MFQSLEPLKNIALAEYMYYEQSIIHALRITLIFSRHQMKSNPKRALRF